MERKPLLDRLLAEAVGVFMLCFVGIMAINNLGANGLAPADGGGLTGVAFAHGLSILVMVAALGHVSGGHFNPAITIGLLLGKHVSPVDAGAYIGAQLAGGLAAGALIGGVFDSDLVLAGTPALHAEVGVGQGILLEAVATFFLVLTVYGTAVDKRAPASVYPVAIGLSITAGILAIGPLTGASLNPARWFGPALIGGSLDNAVVWIVGPILGGVAAWALHDLVIRPAAQREPVVDAPSDK